MNRLADLGILARHYTDLFGSRGILLLAERMLRRAFPARAYRPIQCFLWPTGEVRQRTNDQQQDSSIVHPPSSAVHFPFPILHSPSHNTRHPTRDWFTSRFPGAVEQKIAAAGHICDHTFDFLGTGPTHWGDPIDWHRDVKSGHRWPVKFYTEYRSDELMPGDGVDIKIPWELSRLHHFVTLAQAHWLTGDERYTNEIFSQWESWRTANPWLHGIHWTNPMEAAIRAINLLWTRTLLADAPDLSQAVNLPTCNLQLSTVLREDGLFIEHNLEVSARNGHIVAGNHYLANVCGLACLGLACPELPEAGRWRRVGLKALEQEMQRQVLPDGFFESSTSYHRLAVELFLIPALLARQRGHEMSHTYWERLERMLEVILYITRPDGYVPQIGDNDDGRLLILGGYPDWPRHDYRYLLALGAVLFERGDFKAAAFRDGPLPPSPPLPTLGEGGTGHPLPASPPELGGTEGGAACPEEVFWLLGREGVEQFDALEPDPTPLGSRAFPYAGLYVIRNHDNSDYALLRTSTELGQEKRKQGNKEIRKQGDRGNRAPTKQFPFDKLRAGSFSLFHLFPFSLIPFSTLRQAQGSAYSLFPLPTAHAHNDALSLELWMDGQPVFVDPGTYCYTSDLKARNQFRSTAAHNTVMVDGQEINRIPPDEPFRLEWDARVRVLEWYVDDDEVRLVAEHDGYGRLASPVRHRRHVHYDAISRSWNVTDELEGTGTHQAIWRWHGSPDIPMHVEQVNEDVRHIQVATLRQACPEQRRRAQDTAPAAQVLVAIDSPVLAWSHNVERSSYAPRYGSCKLANRLRVVIQFEERCSLFWQVHYRHPSTDVTPSLTGQGVTEERVEHHA